ncbi:MAG: alkaline phosphatase family protein [bacterium]
MRPPGGTELRAAIGLSLALALAAMLGGCDRKPEHRVLVIGLDGATFDVVDPLLREGLMPNLARLQAAGSSHVLQTIVPAISPPAWTSATTGVNPGKHNIFDFFHLSKTGPQPLLTSALDRRAHPVWHFLNQDGWRTALMNIPMTFPPDRVDGFFISGFPFGAATSGYTYPSALESEIQPYPLDLFGESIRAGHEGQLLAHFRSTFDRQAQVAEQLMAEKPWDLFWIVFTGTDKVMHFYWKFADEDHPEYDPELAQQYGTAIRDMFVRADEEIGRLVAAAGPDVDVLVMSDHGMGPIYRELRLFNWMKEKGFLGSPASGAEIEAFPPGPFSGLVRVNEKGRDFRGAIHPGAEAEDVARRVRHGLEQLRDPDTGERFAERVMTREEVFHGPYTENAPDVLFQEAPGLFVGRRPQDGSPDQNDVFGLPSYSFSGFHRPTGIFVASGPRFAQASGRDTLSILDVAPILYWLFDSAEPSDLDGEVPDSVVRPDSLAARPPRVDPGRLAVIPPDESFLSDEDRETLESLSYVQ